MKCSTHPHHTGGRRVGEEGEWRGDVANANVTKATGPCSVIGVVKVWITQVHNSGGRGVK